MPSGHQNPNGPEQGVAGPNKPGDRRASIEKLLVGGAAVILVVWIVTVEATDRRTSERPSNQESSQASRAHDGSAGGTLPGPVEEKPPVGTDHLLSVAQIRYCLAELIRIEGVGSELNTRSELEVQHFNQIVADYNSRCSKYEYYEDQMAEARSAVEPRQASLVAEARAAFSRRIGDTIPAPRASASAPPAHQSSSADRADAREERAPTVTGAASGATPSAAPRSVMSKSFETITPSVRADMPDMSAASTEERRAIEAACHGALENSGPSTYYWCIRRELRALAQFAGKPDMSAASTQERQGIEAACTEERENSGPATYYWCIRRELRALAQYAGKPDMSGAPTAERQAIESACNSERLSNGPAAYYGCIRRELRARGYGGF